MNGVTAALALTLTLCLAAQPAAAQQPPPGTPFVQGRVTSANPAGTPLANVRVAAIVDGLAGLPVFTDAEGSFALPAPERGYRLRVMKSGYLTHEMRGPRAGTRVELSLLRSAVLSGRITDSRGEGIAGVMLTIRPADRGQVSQPTVRPVTTDDLGEFRFVAAPGRYVVDAGVDAVHCSNADQCVFSPAPSQEVELRTGQDTRVLMTDERPDFLDRMLMQTVRQQATVRLTDNAAIVGPAATASGAPPPQGSVRGRVTDWNGTPLGGVTVQLGDSPGRSSRTDIDGNYEISGLAGGTFAISASRLGHKLVATSAGGPQTVTLGNNQKAHADIVVRRPGAITGTIVDETGEPYEGLVVKAMQARFVGGRVRLEPVAPAPVRATDDRGRYRLFNLPPGTYYVAVSQPPSSVIPGGRPLQTSPAVFYPGRSTAAEALPLQVDAGTEVPSASMTFGPFQGTRVRGMARRSSGQPITGTAILASRARQGDPAMEPLAAPIADGRFEFPYVPPGEYVVQVVGWKTWEVSEEFGALPVSVNGSDPIALEVTTSPPATVAGVIRLEGNPANRVASDFAVRAVAADPDLVPALPVETALVQRTRPQADGRFTMTGLMGPQRITAAAPEGWWLKSATVAGVNVADDPHTFTSDARLEVVFARGGGSISGRLTNADRAALAGYPVIAFPADPLRIYPGSRYLAMARSDAEGRFTLSSLPPGDYSIVAVAANLDGEEWQNPHLLTGLTYAARRMSLREGDRATVELQPATPR